MTTLRILVVALFAVVVAHAAPARAQVTQQQTVNQALATIERMKTDQNFQKNFQPELASVRAVMIVPSLFKGGFILGGQYGNGVLLARDPNGGGWSNPAFYRMSGGSLGLQIGLTDTSILFLIRTERGLSAVMNSQFKFGADAGVTFVAIGGGIGASTTAALGADIVAFSLGGVGLYGGISLEGSALSPRESWNAAYYGQNATPRSILIDRSVSNPQADRLRDFLAR